MRKSKIFAISSCVLLCISLTGCGGPGKTYEKAQKLLQEGKYQDAADKFNEVSSYEDAEKYIKYCSAKIAAEDGNYQDAISTLDSLDDFIDSKDLAKYYLANSLELENNYAAYIQAKKIYNIIPSYVDSKKRLEDLDAKIEEYINGLEIGSIFTFGNYEQDNDLNNGKEFIEWFVIDKQDDKIMVISKNAIEGKVYHSVRERITWDKCDLRNWLNTDFYQEAFSVEEQEKIIFTTIYAVKDSKSNVDEENDTEDKVFLLNAEEAEKYFKSDSERKCKPTSYAKANGASTDSKGFCLGWWILPYVISDGAFEVNSNGEIDCWGSFVDVNYNSVRPAMWIDLKSLSSK